MGKSLTILVAAIISTAMAFSQGTDLGTIHGTVTDASGGVISGAQVEVTDLTTNIVRTIKTGTAGDYDASGLRTGKYKVTVSVDGFASAQVLDIEVRSGSLARADVTLRPKGSAQSVMVSSEALTIETESPTISATLSGELILELPRDSRDIYCLSLGGSKPSPSRRRLQLGAPRG